MQSMTYGTLPTREEFEAAFDRQCPNGYEIQLSDSDSRAADGFRLGDGSWSEPDLWEACNEIVSAYKEDDVQAIDLVSCIMETLGFEWI